MKKQLEKLKKFWKLIFGRTGILVFLLLVQAVILFGGFALIDKSAWIVNYTIGLLAVIILIYILNARSNSSFKLMWIILILVVPVVGVAFYIFTRVQPGTAYISHRVNALIEEEKDYLTPHKDTLYDVYAESKQECGFMQYLYKRGKYPVYSNASVKYFPLGEDKFQELLYQLERAEKFIFLEYFIVDKGIMWNRILRILARKAREGVEVRFMYDGTCTLSLLPRNYPKRLEQLGIQCKIFAPMRPFLSTHQNNRDHRKIAVIDGRAAFTGGVNLADEYINRKERFGHWKDTAVMLKGEAVWNMTVMFLHMWNVINNSSEPIDHEIHMPHRFHQEPFAGNGFVQPYSDTPLDGEIVGENVYLNIINRARKYVYICTPYLIIDNEMMTALCLAAKSGVDVRIMTPGIPDKKMVFLLTQSYYEQLLEAGVRIYEYQPGFLHAKSFVCDDEIAVVGTINLDYRSLYLHFENGVWFYKNKVIQDILDDFNQTLKYCDPVSIDFCKNRNIVVRAFQSILRLFAPLL